MSNKKQNKVVLRVYGGLGNQLFGYAAARRLSLKNNAELVIDSESGFRNDHLYQRRFQLDRFNIPCREATPSERLEPFSRLRRFFKRRLSRMSRFETRRYVQQEQVEYDERLLNVKVNGTVFLEGYWQSERYFSDIKQVIRSDLRLKPPTDPQNLQLKEQIAGSNAVAIHVRYFDDPGQGGVNNILSDYYVRAIDRLEEKIGTDAVYYLFSDNPEAAREMIPVSKQRVVPVINNDSDNAAFADLWLMSHCRHFIIANSTFSWWGAWLADYPDKIVIAPAVEIREGKAWWGFDGLIPEAWQKC